MKKFILAICLLLACGSAYSAVLREEFFAPLNGEEMRPISGGKLILPAFDDQTMAFELGERNVTMTGQATYAARRAGSPWHDASLITTGKGFILRTKNAAGNSLTYVWDGERVKLRESSVPCQGKCGTCEKSDNALNPPERSIKKLSAKPLSGNPVEDGAILMKGEKNTHFVDVLIALDKSAVQWIENSDFAMAENPFVAYASDAILRANQTIANTDLDQCFSFRLVGVHLLDCDCGIIRDFYGYVDSERLLDESTDAKGLYREHWRLLRNKREELCADIVSIHVSCGTEEPTGVVGISCSLLNENINRKYINGSICDIAYNVCLIESAAFDTTFVHEMGHNMGAGHAKMKNAANSGPALYDYSIGYYFDVADSEGEVFRHCATVMAYNDDGYAKPGRWGEAPENLSEKERKAWNKGFYTEIDFFSSPLHTYRYFDGEKVVDTGIPMGTELNDNTRILSLTYPLVANYRASAPCKMIIDYPLPGADAKSTKTLPFNCMRSQTVRAIPETGYVFAGWFKKYDDVTGEFSEPLHEMDADYRTSNFSYCFDPDETEDSIYYARILPLADDVAELKITVANEYVNGETIEPIVIDVSGCTSLPTVKVTGLPAGLKFTAKELNVKETKTTPAAHYAANTIYGAPTKSGVYFATVTVTTAGKHTASSTIKFIVRKADESLVDVDWNAAAGKVTGSGIYAAGKKVTLKATAGKGSVFAGWYTANGEEKLKLEGIDYRNPSISFNMPNADMNLYAKFIPVEEDVAALDCKIGEWYETGTEIAYVPIDVSGCISLPKIKTANLPTGLKFTATDVYDKKTKELLVPANSIYGKLTKSGVFTAVITATTAGGKVAQKSQVIVVRKLGEFAVRAVARPIADEIPGTIKGTGIYVAGKQVTLTATAAKGFVFKHWERGGNIVSTTASYKFEMPEADPYCEAVFISFAEELAALKTNLDQVQLTTETPLERTISCGVQVLWPLAADGITANTIAVTGLPAGLKFTAGDILKKGSKTEIEIPANTIYSVPTAASKSNKDGSLKPSQVKVTVTTAGKQKVVYPINLTVLPLPEYVVGTFNGVEYNFAQHRFVGGVTFTIDAKGKLSGKIAEAGGVNWTVAAANFTDCDFETGVYSTSFNATFKDTKAKPAITNTQVFEMWIKRNEDDAGFIMAKKAEDSEDSETDEDDEDDEKREEGIEAIQNLWAKAYKDVGARHFTDNKKKYRTYEGVTAASDVITAQGLDEGQSLTLKIETSGKVTATLITEGIAYKPTASTTLLPSSSPTEETLVGKAFIVFPPNTAKKFDGKLIAIDGTFTN